MQTFAVYVIAWLNPLFAFVVPLLFLASTVNFLWLRDDSSGAERAGSRTRRRAEQGARDDSGSAASAPSDAEACGAGGAESVELTVEPDEPSATDHAPCARSDSPALDATALRSDE